MQVLRKILVWLVASSLVAAIVLTVWSLSLRSSLGNSDQLKASLHNSGVYDNLVDSLLRQAEDAAEQGGRRRPSGSSPVQSAALKAFTPKVAKETIEPVVDGFYAWLQGDSAQPDFRVDLTVARDNFLGYLAADMKDRYRTLPACPGSSQPSSSDPLTIDCRPSLALNIDAEIDQAVASIGQTGPLADPVLTADDFKDEQGKSVFADSQNVSVVFQLAQSAWILFALMAVLAALALILLSPTKLLGLRRVAIYTALGGLLLLLGTFINRAAIAAASAGLRQSGEPQSTALIEGVALPLARSLEQTISRSLLTYGLATVIFGALAVISVLIWQRRCHKLS